MSRLANLKEIPGMSPGCFLTTYQGQIEVQHTLLPWRKNMGAQHHGELKHVLTTCLILTPAGRSRHHDKKQKHRQKSHPNLNCNLTPSLED